MGKGVIRFYEPDSEYGYLSNWYMSDFMYAGRRYHSMEQYMMFQKALTFGDLEIADKIMASRDLPEIKKLGRSVAHYNDVLWKTIRVQIMRRGIRAKFQQNPELLYNLLRTGSSLLAECAPRDLVWGIGMDIEDARSGDPKEWKGRNLLGRTLMRVREDLRAWCSVAGATVTQYVDAVDLRVPQPVRVSRKQDSDKAERIRRELEAAAGIGEALPDPSSENKGTFGGSVREARETSNEGFGSRAEDYSTRRQFGADDTESSSDVSVWNMHIYEACMLPYLSEIVATWMEEVFFNLRRSRSYEDLGVANYTFEELEWMLRSGQSAGLPIAGFFEMKQDIFDLMRYRGGLRNPATLLAQVESMTDGFHETIPSTDTELAEDEIEEASSEQYEETHIFVDVANRDVNNRLVGTQDPGRTSAPETYLGASTELSPAVTAQSYVPEEGEEATTNFGSAVGEGVRADDLWSSIRNMEDDTAAGDETAVEAAAPVSETAETAEETGSEPIELELTAIDPDTEYDIIATAEYEVVSKPETEEYPFTAAGSTEAAAEYETAEAGSPVETEYTTAENADAEAYTAAAETVSAEAGAGQYVGAAAGEEAAESTYEAEPAETAYEPAGTEYESTARDEAAETAAYSEEAAGETAYAGEPETVSETVSEAAETAATETADEASDETAEDEEEPEEDRFYGEEESDEADEDEADEEEDEDEDSEADEDEDEDEEEDEEEEDFPEPPAPKTQFIPHTEPAPQRPLTYRDEVRSEIVIKHGNIAAVDCDCVVNATNTTLLGGNGLDNSIMKAAGPELLRECAALKGCDVGRAKISGGYRLKAQFVIHTVGPRYSGDETDPVYLTMCYENCLNLAMKYDIHSIAFPPISTGYYGYPLREATLVASRTVQSWMRRHPEYGIKVIFVSADDRTFAMYKDVFK